MNFFNKQNRERYQDRINHWITKYWFLLNSLYIILYLLFIIFKITRNNVESISSNEFVPNFSILWFIVNLIGFIIISLVFISKIKFKFWQYIITIFIGFFLIYFSYIKITNPNLDYTGMDVPLGNYISAEEAIKYGTLDMIEKWNDRANPYDNSDCLKDTIRMFIQKYNLYFLSFNKWKHPLDTATYNLPENNRAFMHPPLTPLVISFFLKAFPFGKWTSEFAMLLITFFSIFLVIFFSHKKGGVFKSSIVIIALISSPVFLKTHFPSADQLSMLLFTIPIFLLFFYSVNKFTLWVLFGIIYGLCFYTKFNVIFFIFLLTVSILIHHKQLSFKPIVGFIIGFLIPIIIFTLLGYYFWLTIITGYFITKMYVIHNPVNFFGNFTKFLYFGPSFLLLLFKLLINSNKIAKKIFPIYIPLIISLLILVIYLYRFSVWNRYLMQYMPCMMIFLLSTGELIELKKRDLFISLLANYIFLQMNLYF